MTDKDLIKDYKWLRCKYEFFLHMKCLRQASLKFNLLMQLDIQSLQVCIEKNSHTFLLYPKYAYIGANGIKFSKEFYNNSALFSGWSFDENPIVIDSFKNKLYFKDFLTQSNIPTPPYSTSNSDRFDEFIIKKNPSSNGEGISGPFTRSDQIKIPLEESEFFETFIYGDIIKIWFWNEMPICFERQTMPKVLGDGISTLTELIKRTYEISLTPMAIQRINQLLSLKNYNLDHVLEKNESQLLEFIYGKGISPFLPVTLEVVEDLEDEILDTQLFYLGHFLHQLLMQTKHHDMAYTVDAIYDGNKKLWVLEANSNPCIHPLLYTAMLGKTK